MTANADPPEDHRDPACCASLLTQGPDSAFVGSRLTLSTAYPLTDHEPPTVELDEDTKAQLLATGKEDTDPLDYVKAENVHGLLAVPRAYLATDKSAAAERAASDELKEALLEEHKVRNPTKGASLIPIDVRLNAAHKRVVEAEAAVKCAAQSTLLRPELVWVTFDPNSHTFTVAAEYLNQLPETASVAISLPRTKGLTLADLDVDIAGYPNKSAYKPIKEAEAIFKEACASANKSASIQAMDKSAHTVTVKVPAATAAAPARFTARFVLTCDDADAKALLLPSKPGAAHARGVRLRRATARARRGPRRPLLAGHPARCEGQARAALARGGEARRGAPRRADLLGRAGRGVRRQRLSPRLQHAVAPAAVPPLPRRHGERL